MCLGSSETKIYLWASLTQERLNSLAILSIEIDLVKKIGVESTMKRFADLKARKNVLGRIMNVFSLYLSCIL